MDVPGVKESDIHVSLDDRNVLKINGETKNRRFQKIMTVDANETDLSQLSAQLADGVLTVTAPPKAKPAPIMIPVTTTTNDDIVHHDETTDEDETMMRLSIEIPGVKHSDLKVTLEEGTTLHVRGWKRGKEFDKTFRIDTDKIHSSELTANLSHGILLVQAPKLPKPTPQTLTIISSPAESTNSDTVSDADVLVSMDMPGVRTTNLTVKTVYVDQRYVVLDIQGSRTTGDNKKKIRISKMILVDSDTHNLDELKACLSDGVLTITAPKKPKVEPTTIPILLPKTATATDQPTNEESGAVAAAENESKKD
jgi:HSP20 family molecular chaperone IbpA